MTFPARQSSDFEAQFAAWVAQRKADALARRRARAVRMRRVCVRDPLPLARVWMRGPKWQRAFHVQHLAIAEAAPASAPYHRPAAKRWWYDFEDDVRELVCRDEIRPGVSAEWGDPFEQFGIRRKDLEAR